MKIHILVVSFILNGCFSRDFYVGMFKKDDLLVASDTVFKERIPLRLAYAKYGRIFQCKITYFRVVDRLGTGRMPTVQIIRGGLGKNYIVLRLISGYNLPLSVNIYVGCENKLNFTRSTYVIRPSTESVPKKAIKASTVKAINKNEITNETKAGIDATTAATVSSTVNSSIDSATIDEVTIESSTIDSSTIDLSTINSSTTISSTTLANDTNPN